MINDEITLLHLEELSDRLEMLVHDKNRNWAYLYQFV